MVWRIGHQSHTRAAKVNKSLRAANEGMQADNDRTKAQFAKCRKLMMGFKSNNDSSLPIKTQSGINIIFFHKDG